MILVDANVLMYAAGQEHPNRAPSVEFLLAVAVGRIDAAIDAEVLQEVLHRYRAIGRWSEGRRAYDAARQVFSVVLPITAEILDLARVLLDKHQDLNTRDALHAAVVELNHLDAICSYDKHFDQLNAVRRVEPGAAVLA